MLTVSAAGCDGAVAQLPPHGEALVIVNTDLPVPALASRLRVDLYSESGVWFESRDIARSDPQDWPTSFGVYSDDETRERRVLVRIRAYPEGVVRDYAGEHFTPRPDYHPPRIATSIGDLCANAPLLPIGERITLRRGRQPITEILPSETCTPPNRTGSVAARIEIAQSGSYRFSVARSVPYETPTTLLLRSRCEDPSSQIECQAELTASIVSSGHFPRFDAKLEPGTYWLMSASSQADWPADLTLEAMALEGPAEDLPPLVSDTPASARPALPRMVRPGVTGPDETPAVEPLPSATVERLLVLRLTPGKRGTVRVTLRGACAGTAAKLGQEPSSPDLSSAETCVDREAERVPVAETAFTEESPSSASEQGSFGQSTPCDPGASSDEIACVSGGPFLFGSRLVTALASTPASSSPERIAVMDKFYLDRYEVDVAHFRAAIARGFPLDEQRMVVNDEPFGSGATQQGKIRALCLFGHAASDHEDSPVNCINHSLAREYCQFVGGDLPTEAQWEYAAAVAARPRKTLYPWGEDVPTCERAVFQRIPGDIFPQAPGTCLEGDAGVSSGARPMPVRANDGRAGIPGDASPAGIFDLAGNVGEWTLDGGESYGSACWSAAPLRNPRCVDEQAPYRVVRGGAWVGDALPTSWRTFANGGVGVGIPNQRAPGIDIGFRCAYTERPR
jgi:formylglycine-generating enzyme required for sulfatase activity